MPLLAVDDILKARAKALQNLNQSTVNTGQVSLSHGTGTNVVNTISTTPAKKIFSIVSWNIQDYKGSKVESIKDNPYVNQFVKVLAEALQVDLMMLIETYIDMSEAVSEIEHSDGTNMGIYSYNPPKTTVTGSMEDPYEDTKALRDDPFYLKVKSRVEALAEDSLTLNYVPIPSPPTFKRVHLPASFTMADFQKGILNTDPKEWAESLEEISHCYVVEVNSSAVTFQKLIGDLAKSSKWQVNSMAGAVKFTLKTQCGTCSGTGAVTGFTCVSCQGSGAGWNRQCVKCNGWKKLSTFQVCTNCNGAKGGTVQCMPCGGTGAVTAQAQCINCGGMGGGFVPCPTCHGQWPNCMDCSGMGGSNITCGNCLGYGAIPTSAVCNACQGAKAVYVGCTPCQGLGGTTLTTQCDRCQGFGVEPRYICTGCKGLGFIATGKACTTCNNLNANLCGTCKGTGQDWAACVACERGLTPDYYCPPCNGKGKRTVCPTCYGSKLFDPETEANALASLCELLTPKSFPNIDVETYTLLWRNAHLKLPSSFTAGNVPASDEKAVWVNPSAAGLASKDEKGKELGYQDNTSLFNGRAPFVVPLRMCFDGKYHFVPLVLFHAIWGVTAKMTGSDKKKIVEARMDSVVKMADLAVFDGDKPVAVGKASNSIIVGDLNLEYQTGLKKNKFSKAFDDLNKIGYEALVGGTYTGVTVNKTGLDRLTKATSKNKNVYTYAYDQFLVKGKELNANVVNCGVIDVLGYLETLIQNNSNLQIALDGDYGSSLGTNEARAFYLYRKFISDHLPIIFDFAVDETDAEYKKRVSDHTKQALEKWTQMSKPPKSVQNYQWGNWQALQGASTQIYAVEGKGNKVTVRGRVARVRLGDVVAVDVILNTHGQKTDTLRVEGVVKLACKIGDWVEGHIELAKQPESTDRPIVGVWKSMKTTTETKYRCIGIDKTSCSVVGTIEGYESPDLLRVLLRKKLGTFVFIGQTGGGSGSSADIGNRVEGLFSLE